MSASFEAVVSGTVSRSRARLRGARAGWRSAVAAMALMALPGAAAAQQSSGRALTLEEAVRTALEQSRGIALGRLQLEVSNGELLVARGAYDTRLRTTVREARQERRVLSGAGGVSSDPASSRTSAYTLDVTRELPGGITIQPSISLNRTEDGVAAATPFTQAGASVGLVVPLGYNRGGQLTRSAERAAGLGVDASTFRYREEASDVVHEVVSAYWEYRAANDRLSVLRSSEERAVRLLEETRTLVDAQERPVTDLNQVQANASSKRIARLSAEQQLLGARQRLTLAMGVRVETMLELPAPGDSFPVAVRFRADPAALGRLAALAAARRPELAAADLQARSARVLHEAARAGMRPTVDLVVNLGYSGLAAGGGLGGVFAPLYRDIPGVNATLQLSYQAALSNRQAAGRTLQRAAALDQQHVSHRDQRERIAAAVTVAAAALEHGVAILEESENAVGMYRTAVENEKKKYALGVSTLFDMITAEDNLTGAQLADVSGRLQHALSLARLRHETGTLIDGVATELRFDAEAATTLP